MARSHRPSVVPAFMFVALFIAAPPAINAGAGADAVRITAAANVTVRAMPSSDAAPVAQLPLGTEVADAGPTGLDKTWLRVKLADGREGWLLASLTRPLDPVWRWPTFDSIIASRLGRKGDGFPATTELVAFIERVAPEYTDPDGRARVELARLHALAKAAAAIPFKGAAREPYASWLAARKDQVVYDEPGGRWILSYAALWDLHAKYSATAPADDIAWFAVTNGLPGECEGAVPCYLVWRNHLQGEYLRRHPFGKHAAEAIGEIRRTADLLAAPARPRSGFVFDRARDCREMTASIDALAAAVKASHGEARDATLGSLATLRSVCQ